MEWKEYTNHIAVPYTFWGRLKWLLNRESVHFKFSVYVKTGKHNNVDVALPQVEIVSETPKEGPRP